MAHSQSQCSGTHSAVAASLHRFSDRRNSFDFGRNIHPVEVRTGSGSGCIEVEAGSSGLDCTPVHYRHLGRDMSILCRRKVDDRPSCVVVGKCIC